METALLMAKSNPCPECFYICLLKNIFGLCNIVELLYKPMYHNNDSSSQTHCIWEHPKCFCIGYHFLISGRTGWSYYFTHSQPSGEAIVSLSAGAVHSLASWLFVNPQASCIYCRNSQSVVQEPLGSATLCGEISMKSKLFYNYLKVWFALPLTPFRMHSDVLQTPHEVHCHNTARGNAEARVPLSSIKLDVQ